MNKKDTEQLDNRSTPPRVIADFGGRRKTFERRIRRKSIDHRNRRDDQDRRSGFDRRGVFPQDPTEQRSEKRKSLSELMVTQKTDGLDSHP